MRQQPSLNDIDHFINGRLTPGGGTVRTEVTNPATGRAM